MTKWLRGEERRGQGSARKQKGGGDCQEGFVEKPCAILNRGKNASKKECAR